MTEAKPALAETRYRQIIERVFFDNYEEGATSVSFVSREMHDAADALRISRIRNPPDIVSSFRFRQELPKALQVKAPKGKVWVIRGAGKGKYRFDATETDRVVPTLGLEEIKLLDASPGVISKYALTAEQSLLAKVRYNRLVDIFAGVTCYSLQTHLQTQVGDVGQVEADEVYLGMDRHGAHYVFPVEAKGGSDRLSIVQTEQGLALARRLFPDVICRPIATQFMAEEVIAMFEFKPKTRATYKYEVSLVSEKHYRLVGKDELSAEELTAYRREAERFS